MNGSAGRTSGYRYGIVVPQDAPFSELQQRWQTVEQLGFDMLYVPDTSRDWRSEHSHWFDCWTVLAAMAQATTKVRVGTLVTQPILRPPTMLAKAAATIDHLSGGRLELGIGTGIAPFDHQATGSDYWPIRERVQRYREYVEVVDGLLRSADTSFGYRGEYYRTEGLAMLPAPVQQPRPPIIVGGKAPTVRRVAVERAEIWNSDGPFGASIEERVAVTRDHSRELDRWCEQHDRDPASLRRSFLFYQEPGPGTFHHVWDAPDTFGQVVERFAAIGISDFVLHWPEDDAQRKVFEHVTTEVLPRLPRA